MDYQLVFMGVAIIVITGGSGGLWYLRRRRIGKQGTKTGKQDQ